MIANLLFINPDVSVTMDKGVNNTKEVYTLNMCIWFAYNGMKVKAVLIDKVCVQRADNVPKMTRTFPTIIISNLFICSIKVAVFGLLSYVMRMDNYMNMGENKAYSFGAWESSLNVQGGEVDN